MHRPLFDRATELLREALETSGLERHELISEALRLHRLSLTTEDKPGAKAGENGGAPVRSGTARAYPDAAITAQLGRGGRAPI